MSRLRAGSVRGASNIKMPMVAGHSAPWATRDSGREAPQITHPPWKSRRRPPDGRQRNRTGHHPGSAARRCRRTAASAFPNWRIPGRRADRMSAVVVRVNWRARTPVAGILSEEQPRRRLAADHACHPWCACHIGKMATIVGEHLSSRSRRNYQQPSITAFRRQYP